MPYQLNSFVVTLYFMGIVVIIALVLAILTFYFTEKIQHSSKFHLTKM